MSLQAHYYTQINRTNGTSATAVTQGPTVSSHSGRLFHSVLVHRAALGSIDATILETALSIACIAFSLAKESLNCDSRTKGGMKDGYSQGGGGQNQCTYRNSSPHFVSCFLLSGPRTACRGPEAEEGRAKSTIAPVSSRKT